ncbi:hypothetical protein SAMN05444680_12020 [Variovorax sp. YR216]|nr:hypothetical protein SAMN05444680_12020 [Variovorax sp. YR216]
MTGKEEPLDSGRCCGQRIGRGSRSRTPRRADEVVLAEEPFRSHVRPQCELAALEARHHRFGARGGDDGSRRLLDVAQAILGELGGGHRGILPGGNRAEAKRFRSCRRYQPNRSRLVVGQHSMPVDPQGADLAPLQSVEIVITSVAETRCVTERQRRRGPGPPADSFSGKQPTAFVSSDPVRMLRSTLKGWCQAPPVAAV